MEHIENLMKIGYRQRAYDAEERKIAADIVRVCVMCMHRALYCAHRLHSVINACD